MIVVWSGLIIGLGRTYIFFPAKFSQSSFLSIGTAPLLGQKTVCMINRVIYARAKTWNGLSIEVLESL